MKAIALILVTMVLPTFAQAEVPADDSADFEQYMVTAIRITGPLNIRKKVELSSSELGATRVARIPLTPEQKKNILPGQSLESQPYCVLHLRPDLLSLAPSGEIYRFSKTNGECNSSCELSHETTNHRQEVLGLECGFWPSNGLTLGMLKKTIGSSVQVVEAVRVKGSIVRGLEPIR